jgi:hypothetical protein
VHMHEPQHGSGRLAAQHDLTTDTQVHRVKAGRDKSLDAAGYSDPSPIRQQPGQDMLIVASGAVAVNSSGLLWPVQGDGEDLAPGCRRGCQQGLQFRLREAARCRGRCRGQKCKLPG